MKKLILVTAGLAFSLTNIKAQTPVYDSVEMGAQYANDIYYSLENGAVGTEVGDNWHLGFGMLPQGGPSSSVNVMANHVHGKVEVFSLGLPASTHFTTLTAADTIGKLTNNLYNSTFDWLWGAFNQTRVQSSPFDYGWGMYSLSTHNVEGDSLFIVNVGTETYKMTVKKYVSNPVDSIAYTFRIAKWDNTNDQEITIYRKDGYTNKAFAYYDIVNQAEVNREPDFGTWDLLFTRYIDSASMGPSGPQVPYGVMGVLIAPEVEIAKSIDLDPLTADPNTASYSDTLNTIGYKWKSFNGTGYSLDSNASYFIKTASSNPKLFQIHFTKFEGSSTGKTVFWVKDFGSLGFNNVTASEAQLVIAPNPAGSFAQLVIDAKNAKNNTNITITDLSGRTVSHFTVNLNQGLNAFNLNLESFSNGTYFVNLANADWRTTEKLIIQK